MSTPQIVTDFYEFCTKHKLDACVLMVPQADGEFTFYACDMTPEDLRQLGHKLVGCIDDSRGPLN
jgi:hypothetical protein